jgi:hypothetical protein
MSKVEKLDLMGVTSLAAVTAALLVGWIVTTSNLPAASARHVEKDRAVTLTEAGSMKLTVTAARENTATATARQSRVASSRQSAGPSLEVALPFAFRP